MSVIVENLVVHKGEDFSKSFTITNADKSLVNISEYSAFAYMAKYSGSEDKTLFTVGITTTSSQIKISLANTVTSDLESGRHYYNLFSIENNIHKKQREGEILVKDSVL